MALLRFTILLFFVISLSSVAETVPNSNAMFDGLDMPTPIDKDPVKSIVDDSEGSGAGDSEGVQPTVEELSEDAEEIVTTAPPQFEAVQIYTQEELIAWINNNTHLTRVVEDECQLVQDIEARADKMRLPTYQFLWGDMLAWGVCVDKNAELGINYIYKAAEQGLPAALEQLGRYYWKGILVQADSKKAIVLMRESASLGFLKAQIEFVTLLNEGKGSPHDYEDAYRWLHGSIISDQKLHKQAKQALARLATKMPEHIVKRAKASAGR